MENKYKLWVARDKDGNLFAYNDKPTRCDNQKEWFAEKFLFSMENSFFPNLTWKDEPIEVELRPTTTYLDEMARKYANSITDNKEIRRIIVGAFKSWYNI